MNASTEIKHEDVTLDNRQVNYFTSLLELVSEQSLFRCMYRMVADEDYEIAALYRDELIKRGKLKFDNKLINED